MRTPSKTKPILKVKTRNIATILVIDRTVSRDRAKGDDSQFDSLTLDAPRVATHSTSKPTVLANVLRFEGRGPTEVARRGPAPVGEPSRKVAELLQDILSRDIQNRPADLPRP